MGESFDDFVTARGDALRRFALELCGDPGWAERLSAAALAKIRRRWKDDGDPERRAKRLIVTAFLASRRGAEERAVLVLHRYEQSPEEEIAALVGIGRGRVAAILERGPVDLPPVEGRRATRRTGRWAVAALALLTVPAVALAVPRGGDEPVRPRPTPTPTTSAPVRPPPADWVYRGTGGAEVAMPASWAKNRLVIEAGANTYHDEPEEGVFVSSIDRVHLGASAGYTTYPTRPVSVEDLPGRRMEARLPEGRHAGYVRIPARGIVVTVRARTGGTVTRILDSLRFVTVDTAGCQVSRFDAPRPGGPPVPAAPAAVSLCAYTAERGGNQVSVKRSMRLTGNQAARLSTLVRRAERPSKREIGRCGVVPDALLTFTDTAGRETTIAVHGYTCGPYLLDDGRTKTIIDFNEPTADWDWAYPLLDGLLPGTESEYGY